jgi:hypothetical protein
MVTEKIKDYAKQAAARANYRFRVGAVVYSGSKAAQTSRN